MRRRNAAFETVPRSATATNVRIRFRSIRLSPNCIRNRTIMCWTPVRAAPNLPAHASSQCLSWGIQTADSPGLDEATLVARTNAAEAIRETTAAYFLERSLLHAARYD